MSKSRGAGKKKEKGSEGGKGEEGGESGGVGPLLAGVPSLGMELDTLPQGLVWKDTYGWKVTHEDKDSLIPSIETDVGAELFVHRLIMEASSGFMRPELMDVASSVFSRLGVKISQRSPDGVRVLLNTVLGDVTKSFRYDILAFRSFLLPMRACEWFSLSDIPSPEEESEFEEELEDLDARDDESIEFSDASRAMQGDFLLATGGGIERSIVNDMTATQLMVGALEAFSLSVPRILESSTPPSTPTSSSSSSRSSSEAVMLDPKGVAEAEELLGSEGISDLRRHAWMHAAVVPLRSAIRRGALRTRGEAAMHLEDSGEKAQNLSPSLDLAYDTNDLRQSMRSVGADISFPKDAWDTAWNGKVGETWEGGGEGGGGGGGEGGEEGGANCPLERESLQVPGWGVHATGVWTSRHVVVPVSYVAETSSFEGLPTTPSDSTWDDAVEHRSDMLKGKGLRPKGRDGSKAVGWGEKEGVPLSKLPPSVDLKLPGTPRHAKLQVRTRAVALSLPVLTPPVLVALASFRLHTATLKGASFPHLKEIDIVIRVVRGLIQRAKEFANLSTVTAETLPQDEAFVSDPPGGDIGAVAAAIASDRVLAAKASSRSDDDDEDEEDEDGEEEDEDEDLDGDGGLKEKDSPNYVPLVFAEKGSVEYNLLARQSPPTNLIQLGRWVRFHSYLARGLAKMCYSHPSTISSHTTTYPLLRNLEVSALLGSSARAAAALRLAFGSPSMLNIVHWARRARGMLERFQDEVDKATEVKDSEIQKLKSQIMAMQDQVTSLRDLAASHKDDAEKEKKKASGSKKVASEMSDKAEREDKENSKLRDEIANLKKALDKASKDVKEASAMAGKHTSKIKTLESTLATLRREKAITDAKAKSDEATSSSATPTSAGSAAAPKLLEEVRGRLAQREKELRSAKIEAKRLDTLLQDSEQRGGDAHAKLTVEQQERAKLESQVKSLSEQLKDAQSVLKTQSSRITTMQAAKKGGGEEGGKGGGGEGGGDGSAEVERPFSFLTILQTMTEKDVKDTAIMVASDLALQDRLLTILQMDDTKDEDEEEEEEEEDDLEAVESGDGAEHKSASKKVVKKKKVVVKRGKKVEEAKRDETEDDEEESEEEDEEDESDLEESSLGGLNASGFQAPIDDDDDDDESEEEQVEKKGMRNGVAKQLEESDEEEEEEEEEEDEEEEEEEDEEGKSDEDPVMVSESDGERRGKKGTRSRTQSTTRSKGKAKQSPRRSRRGRAVSVSEEEGEEESEEEEEESEEEESEEEEERVSRSKRRGKLSKGRATKGRKSVKSGAKKGRAKKKGARSGAAATSKRGVWSLDLPSDDGEGGEEESDESEEVMRGDTSEESSDDDSDGSLMDDRDVVRRRKGGRSKGRTKTRKRSTKSSSSSSSSRRKRGSSGSTRRRGAYGRSGDKYVDEDEDEDDEDEDISALFSASARPRVKTTKKSKSRRSRQDSLDSEDGYYRKVRVGSKRSSSSRSKSSRSKRRRK